MNIEFLYKTEPVEYERSKITGRYSYFLTYIPDFGWDLFSGMSLAGCQVCVKLFYHYCPSAGQGGKKVTWRKCPHHFLPSSYL